MKKNLFLLFAIYFFVIQSCIIAFLWNDTRFLALGIINLGIILIISLSYGYFEKGNKKDDEGQNVSFKKEREAFLIEKTGKKGNPKNKLFWISLIFAIIAFLFFKGYLFSNKLLIASGIGFILFISFFYISGLYRHHKFLKLRNSKAYLIIFIIGLIISGFDATVPEIKQETAVGCIINVVSNGGKYTTTSTEGQKDTYSSIEGDIIKSSSGENQPLDSNVPNIETGSQIIESGENTKPKENYLYDGDITILDAIRYLISNNDIPLDTKQNVKFTYISYQNPNYAYFKTAFMKKMIGTNTNPDKAIICQTYIVMKGIAKSRDIENKNNSLEGYRNKADELGELNGCQKNKYVNIDNL